MSSVLNTVISLVRTPSMFIAIIAFLGLVLQKKSFSDIIKGTLKTFIGMVILTQGVNILSTSITPLSNGLPNYLLLQMQNHWVISTHF